MAVLEKRLGLHLSASDAYVNIAGGIRMNEPAVDLGILLAVVSSYKDIVIDDKVLVFGEVGLSGEVRAVSMAEQRVQEAKKLGFTTVILDMSLPQIKHTDTGLSDTATDCKRQFIIQNSSLEIHFRTFLTATNLQLMLQRNG